MRNTQKAAVLLLLVAGAFAGSAPIKTKLGQLNAKTLAQVQGGNAGGEEAAGGQGGAGGAGYVGSRLRQGAAGQAYPLECPCEFSQLPQLGAGLTSNLASHLEQSQVQELRSVPDTQYNEICQANCCECSQAAQAAQGYETKNRTFVINGAITVLEEISIASNAQANEYSKGEEEKDTVCVLINQSNTPVTVGALGQGAPSEWCPTNQSAGGQSGRGY